MKKAYLVESYNVKAIYAINEENINVISRYSAQLAWLLYQYVIIGGSYQPSMQYNQLA